MDELPMSSLPFRAAPWVGQLIYAQRTKLAHTWRMEADDHYDDLYRPVIDAFDVLLAHLANEADDNAWQRGVAHFWAQWTAAILGDCDRCDLFIEMGHTLRMDR
ncbi:hypothetical protein [Burkholderia orbicola]|uniref:hypothetical protein n=1 Tax=Burkholderia orbicola TaxID=2978683 RepID=UPI002FE05C1B